MTCVLVLGLPRSGTSAVAGVLQHLGVFMGERLMPAMPDVNARGFFEDEEFVEMHIRLMRSHEDPQILFDVPEPPDEQQLECYRDLIHRREDQHHLWGIKDPKLCFLLPYFLQRLRTMVRLVRVRRPFHESVQSMRPLYGGMSLERSATLLARYLYSLDRNLAATRSPLLTLEYTHLLGASGREFVGTLADFVGADPVTVSGAHAFLEPGLRHQK